MSAEALKLKVLEQFPEEGLLQDEVYLSKLRTQLEQCQVRLAEAQNRYDNIREIVVLGPSTGVNIAAALEWKEIKDEILRLNGKSIKLHKEITELEHKLKRRQVLRSWAKQ
jgi:hypothetical protein